MFYTLVLRAYFHNPEYRQPFVSIVAYQTSRCFTKRQYNI